MPGCDRRLHRRTVVSAIGTGSLFSLAGCTRSEDPPSEAPDTPDASESDPEAFAHHPGDGPTDFPPDHICNGVCGMTAAEYPEWNAQLAHTDEKGAYFCSVGCLFTYLVAPDRVDAHDTTIEEMWIRDYVTTDLIAASGAYLVLEDDPDRDDEPMGLNPRPFLDREDAETYAAEYGFTDDDIIQIDELTLEIARIYRPYQLPTPSE